MVNLSEYEVTEVECKWNGYGRTKCDWYELDTSKNAIQGRCPHCVDFLRCNNIDLLAAINDALKIFDNKEE